MQINLTQPIPVTETTVTETLRETANIEFVYADFANGLVRLKIQPWNTEITIQGEDYEAMRQQFEGALSAAFSPAINAYLTALLPPPEEVQE